MRLTEEIRATDREVRKFGVTFAVLGVVAAAYALYRGSGIWIWLVSGGGILLILGIIARPLLRPLYIGWMTFAHVLAWINTRLILGVFFFLALTPIGLILRITGKDLLQQKIDKSAKSYWIRREKVQTEPSRYRRMF